MAPLSPGDRLGGRFELVRILGQGGMGEVWLAQDLELDEALALKLLHPELAARGPLVELLKSECRRTRALLHPNIVRLFDFHRLDDRFFLSMEYLDGGDIGRFRGEAPQRLVQRLMPVVDALAYAHGEGIIHRDIKVSNVLLGHRGAVKLADFGIAGLLTQKNPEQWADGGGSPRSVSPQQLAGAPPDPRDDIYSLGALFRDLLSSPETSAAGASQAAPRRFFEARDAGVSDELATLVESMLASEVEQRPADMEKVKRQLMVQVPPPEERTRPPGVSVGAPSIDAVNYRGGVDGPRPAPAPAVGMPAGVRQTPDRKLLAVTSAAFIILGLMAVGVFWYLPRLVQERSEIPAERSELPPPASTAPIIEEQRPEDSQPEPAAGARDPVAAGPSDAERLSRTKTRAEEALDALVARRSELQARGAEDWGQETFAEAQVHADQGDTWFLAEDYLGALTSYQAALAKLDELASRAKQVLADLLREGGAALDSGEAETAVNRFEFALRVEPGNEEATQGLERARKLVKVNELLAEAKSLEQADRLEEAAKLYREVIALAPESPMAKEGVERVEAAISERAYQEHMSRGLAALESGKYDDAGKAFEEAKKLRPEAPAVNDALVRLRQAVRRQRIASIRGRAQALEGQQRWGAAAEQYRAALAIDSTLVFAQQGAARTARWDKNDAALTSLLADPRRLYSPQPYERAVELLHDLESDRQLPKSIKSKSAELARLVDAAGQKITVSLLSDSQTEVVVYRVGKLGRFERRDLQLRPGSYTVVGSCAGYRDVRHTIRVEPDRTVPPLMVRCEEKI